MISSVLASAALGWSYADFVLPPAPEPAPPSPVIEPTSFNATPEPFPPQSLPAKFQPLAVPQPKPQPKPQPQPAAKRLPAYYSPANDGTVWYHDDPAYLSAYVTQYNAHLVQDAGWPPANTCLSGYCR